MEDSSVSPLVLVHRPPALDFIDEPLSHCSYTVLTNTSPEPFPDFLSTQAASIRAVVSLGRLPLTAEFLSNLPALGIVVCASVGFDHVDLDECKRRRIMVTNAGGAYGEDVADLAVGLLISVLRRIPAVDRYVRSSQWTRLWDYPLGLKLNGKKVGIVGLGSIGSLVAKRLEPFGYITTLTTPNQIEVMETLGKNGVIINIGRGELIDEKEMVLEQVIWGVGLDVFENEPEVPEELFGLKNVVLSPHAAGMTKESLDNVSEVVIANLKAFFLDQPLMFSVQLD